MKRGNFVGHASAWLLCPLLVLAGCAKSGGNKMSITTASDAARESFLQGRNLAERLQGQESLQYFEKAIEQDPDFALAYLNYSFNQPTAKGFFEQLHKAVALAEKASEAERLQILAFQAGVNGDPAGQKEYLEKLVVAFPDDERAHNLLGNYYFGQQAYADAIAEYNKATAIAPDFSPPYNQLGYAYRSLEDYAASENAFKKYIELIPDDPNPYDSYAELLLKMGRYDESIEQYRNALAHNPNFVASHIGISTDYCLKGEYDRAQREIATLYDMARNDGERRAALAALTVAYVDEGKTEMALKELDKQYALGEKINDAAAMAGDLGTIGAILQEAGKYDEALEKYRASVKVTDASDLSSEVKENARRLHLNNEARIALLKKDLTTAKAKSAEFRSQAEAARNNFQLWLARELAGMIAMEEGAYDLAIDHFQQANLQNPYTIYRLATAYEAKGDLAKAKETCAKAAGFNALNSLNYAFMRKQATQRLALIS